MRLKLLLILFVSTLCCCKEDSSSKDEYTIVKAHGDNDFNEFYKRFITDTIFQMSRIKFPLKGHYADYSGEIEWTKKDWDYIQFDFRDEKVLNELEDSNSIIQNDSVVFYGNTAKNVVFLLKWNLTKLMEFGF